MRAVFIDSDGSTVELTEPRAIKMIRHIAALQGELKSLPRGHIELDFADPRRDIKLVIARILRG